MRKKVHPSPPPPHKDAVSVLKILPVAIASLSVALLPQEQEVLAYLIACSCSCTSSLPMHHKMPNTKMKTKRSNRKPSSAIVTTHTPVFDCRCFECYMSFWSRWDASPNRDLIHKAIDLFDDHMAANADRTLRQKRIPNNNVRKSDRNTVECEEGVKRGFKKEEGSDSRCSSPVSRPSSNYDDHHHRNGIMRRVFPNIMGFVAHHLWTVWSPPV